MAVEGARAYNAGARSIPNNSWTNHQLNAERWDNDSIHHLTVNNERLTCQTAGKYLIVGCQAWAAYHVGNRGLRIVLNGSDVIAERLNKALPSGGNVETIPCIQSMEVGDYVVMQAYQNCGSALSSIYSPAICPEFMMQRLGDLPVPPVPGDGSVPAPLLVAQGQI